MKLRGLHFQLVSFRQRNSIECDKEEAKPFHRHHGNGYTIFQFFYFGITRNLNGIFTSVGMPVLGVLPASRSFLGQSLASCFMVNEKFCSKLND